MPARVAESSKWLENQRFTWLAGNGGGLHEPQLVHEDIDQLTIGDGFMQPLPRLLLGVKAGFDGSRLERARTEILPGLLPLARENLQRTFEPLPLLDGVGQLGAREWVHVAGHFCDSPECDVIDEFDGVLTVSFRHGELNGNQRIGGRRHFEAAAYPVDGIRATAEHCQVAIAGDGDRVLKDDWVGERVH